MRKGWMDAERGRIEDVNVNTREDGRSRKPRASLIPAMLARIVIFLGQNLFEKIMTLLLAAGVLLSTAAVVAGVIVVTGVVVVVIGADMADLAVKDRYFGPISSSKYILY